MTDIHSGFQNVDGRAQDRAFFEFLDRASALTSIVAIREQMKARHGPVTGVRLLDVGCGLAHQVLDLAEEVGDQGQAWGIDLSVALIEEARRRARARGLHDRVRLEVADITRDDVLQALGLSGLHIIRLERVLMYLASPQTVVERLAGALAPGGHLVAFEFDYLGAFVDHPKALKAHHWMQRVSASVPSPMIGRQLSRLMQTAGLHQVQARPQTVMTPFPMFQRVVQGTLETLCAQGVMSSEELASWWHELEALDARGLFFAGFPGFVVSGQRPPG
jgi:ubiquinone/menaquinone biosynthesis C-methylase UbiE